ncbi:PAS domain S-box protein [Pseudomonas gingeri]|nr:PAS domain S-box protein [Pseudomonas gingeri]NWA13231.1 PAS domain S-box protein [Pseudomonas gingeri]NWA55492.1 PAS domain S-box protein [Pseudomonas gingeri]NWA95654.1 PAS domain S-box protein [Pseudomonas gingeri]NWB00741.1 PAS domain S-box protein [Pseudomonas gingeri]
MSEMQMIPSTEPDTADAQARQSQLFEATFDLVSSALVLLNDQREILKANGAFSELLGYTLPELLGAPFSSLLHCTGHEAQQVLFGQFSPVQPLQLHYRRKDGSGQHGRSKLTAVGSLLLCEIVPIQAPRNLDDDSQAFMPSEPIPPTAQALLGNEERSHLAFESAATGMALLALDGRWLRVNCSLCELLGRSEAQLQQTSSQALTHPDDLPGTLACGQRLLMGETPDIHLEKRYRHRDGHYIRVQLTCSAIRSSDNTPLYFVIQIVDLSRLLEVQKRLSLTEARLLTSEQQFHALAENTHNLVIRYDLNCRRTYVNPAFERETGIPAAHALQRYLGEGWCTDVPVEEYIKQLRQVIVTGLPQEIILKWSRPQRGEIVMHTLKLIPELDASGTVVSVLAKGHDITALKRHERLEEALLHIFERLAQGARLPEVLTLVTKYIEQARPEFLANIMLLDDDGLCLLPGSTSSLPSSYTQGRGRIEIGEGFGICATAAWCGTTIIAEDLASHPYCDAFREQALKAGLRACWSEPINDSAGKVLGTFCIYLRHPGRPTNDDLRLVRQASHMAAIAIERKRAETSLLESEQRYREISDKSLDALFLMEVTEDGFFRTIEVNPAYEHYLGMGRAELIGKNIEATLPPDIAAVAIAKSRHCVESGAPLDEEMVLDLPTGQLTYFHSTLIPVRDAYGRVHRIVGIARDITARKNAEQALHTREQEFRALVENTPDVIARFDLQCRFLYANPAAQNMLKRPLAFLLGKNSSEASPRSSAARPFQDMLEHIIQTGKTTEEELTLDVPVEQDGEAACYLVRLVPERDQHGGVVSILAVGRNISAMRVAERRLKESHAQLRQLSSYRENTREEERKRIAREIHDELGQQLTVLRMGISLLRLQFGSDHPLLVERVQALMVRVDETIQVVRNVATSLRPSALDMGLTSALEWLVSEFSQNTGVPCRLRAPSARLELDDERATAIFRVIQECLTNVARHAQASRVEIDLKRDVEHVLIEVRDNGKGFDPEQLPKGRLGMLGMRERGHMLGGTVTVNSPLGQGTHVRVNIPFQANPETP